MSRPDRRNDGFTIVETIIVLAIAGIILMLSLLAIPALQRSSRNNQRKQDVQTILEAVSHYELNNAGTVPSSGGSVTMPKLYYYSTSNITYSVSGNWTDAPSSPVDNASNKLDVVNIYNHEKCDPDRPGHGTRTGAGYSDVVALYAIETRTGSSPHCQQL
jgi:prepilin-type N-terminal cleavage/methylation domain-containing protein